MTLDTLRAWIRRELHDTVARMAAALPDDALWRECSRRGFPVPVPTEARAWLWSIDDEAVIDRDEIERAAFALRDGDVDEALHRLMWGLWDFDFAFRRLVGDVGLYFQRAGSVRPKPGSTP